MPTSSKTKQVISFEDEVTPVVKSQRIENKGV